MDMNTDTIQSNENLAATLARVLPEAKAVPLEPMAALGMHYLAVPRGFELKQIDEEVLLPNPRRTKAEARLVDVVSFCDYVKKHAETRTVAWCQFDPQQYALAFRAVIDEHAPDAAGWRAHQAVHVPAMSAEWKVWSGADRKPMEQQQFAEFLERHQDDIAAVDGYPSSLDMLKLATEFIAFSEKRVKSTVRLQGGGVRLDFVDDSDAATVESMRMFEKFAIGIPVFWAGEPYRIDARLKYRQSGAKVSFWFELLRPDRVHEHAAKDLIAAVRGGIGDVPLLMGECK